MSWIITKDHLDADLTGTGNGTVDEDNATHFRLLDADGNVYCEGLLDGEGDGFEPLRAFGTPSLGCTRIDLFEGGRWRVL